MKVAETVLLGVTVPRIMSGKPDMINKWSKYIVLSIFAFLFIFGAVPNYANEKRELLKQSRKLLKQAVKHIEANTPDSSIIFLDSVFIDEGLE